MLSERLNAVLAHRGANDPITATDLRRALDVLAEEIPSREGLQQTARELLDYQQALEGQRENLVSDRAAFEAERELRAEMAAEELVAQSFAEEDTVLSDEPRVAPTDPAETERIAAIPVDEPTTYAELAAKGDHTTLLEPLDDQPAGEWAEAGDPLADLEAASRNAVESPPNVEPNPGQSDSQ